MSNERSLKSTQGHTLRVDEKGRVKMEVTEGEKVKGMGGHNSNDVKDLWGSGRIGSRCQIFNKLRGMTKTSVAENYKERQRMVLTSKH
jgi:hypothetical protein